MATNVCNWKKFVIRKDGGNRFCRRVDFFRDERFGGVEIDNMDLFGVDGVDVDDEHADHLVERDA